MVMVTSEAVRMLNSVHAQSRVEIFGALEKLKTRRMTQAPDKKFSR